MNSERLNMLICENEIDEILEYAKSLSQNSYLDFTRYLIEELDNTKDGNSRNTIAYLVGELRCYDAIPVLIKLIFSPELKNNRGTLVYALENLKCQNWLVQLIPLLYEGNYEVKLNMYTLLKSKFKDMPIEDKEKGLKIINNKIEEYEDTLDLLYEVYENIFEEKRS